MVLLQFFLDKYPRLACDQEAQLIARILHVIRDVSDEFGQPAQYTISSGLSSSWCANSCAISMTSRLEQRHDFIRAFCDDLHLLLNGSERKFTEQDCDGTSSPHEQYPIGYRRSAAAV